jgi:hypothetical protein
MIDESPIIWLLVLVLFGLGLFGAASAGAFYHWMIEGIHI